MKIAIVGNAGCGKTTLAKKLKNEHAIAAHMPLDEIAWNPGVQRKPLEESCQLLDEFTADKPSWIVEGCYGELITHVLPQVDKLYFLNPGIDVCVERCSKREWEPSKFPSKEDQDKNLTNLIQWVRDYETRTDENSLGFHTKLYDSHTGDKEIIST
jgi:adenylate kinase family enzyme